MLSMELEKYVENTGKEIVSFFHCQTDCFFYERFKLNSRCDMFKHFSLSERNE